MGLFSPGMDTLGGMIAGTPDVPEWQNVSLQKSQTQATNANIANLPKSKELASSINQFNFDEITKMLESAIPGWKNMSSTATAAIQSLLEGKIPKDVQNAIQNNAAAQSLTNGFGGTGLAGNLLATNLRDTSLDNILKGLSSAQSWASMIDQFYAPGQFNVSSMFITPVQQFTSVMENRTQKWNRDWLTSQVDWSGSTGKLIGDEMKQISQQFNDLVSSVVSKAGGTALGGAMG